MGEVIMGIMIVVGILLLSVFQGMLLASLKQQREQVKRQPATRQKAERGLGKKQKITAIKGASIQCHKGFAG